MLTRKSIFLLGLMAAVVFSVNFVVGQSLDEDVAVAEEDLVVEESTSDVGLPVDNSMMDMPLPVLELPTEDAPVLPAVENDAEIPALPVEEPVAVDSGAAAEAPSVEMPAVEAVSPELPVLPVEEAAIEAPGVVDLSAKALEGESLELPAAEALPVVEAPAIDEIPAAEVPVVDEKPMAEAPVIEELPMAEIPVAEEMPVVDVPAGEIPAVEALPAVEMPVAEAPVVEELPVTEAPVVGELPAVEMPAVEEIPVPSVEMPVAEMPGKEPVPAVDMPREVIPAAEEIPAIPGIEPSGAAQAVAAPAFGAAFEGSESLVEGAVKEAMGAGAEPIPDIASLPIDPRIAEISAARNQEAVRRKAYETHALQTLIEAENALQDELYEKATKLYEEARTYIGLREELEPERQRIMNGLANSCYERAKLHWQERKWEDAKNMCKAAQRYGHPDAMKLFSLIEEDEVRPPPVPKPEKIQSRRYSKDYKGMEEEISKTFKLGKQYFQTEEYDKAQEIFETILKRDPHNVEAIRLLEKVARRRHDTGAMERETMRRDMVADVVMTWNPRDYANMIPADVQMSKKPDATTQTTADSQERDTIMKKLKTIVIPEIDFRQANINDVVAFLQEQSVAFDRDEKSGRKGVNIILNLNRGAPPAAAAPAAAAGPVDPFAAPAAAADAGGGPASDIPLITFSARYISLLEALDIVTQVAALKHRIKGSVVMVVPRDDPGVDIVHRMYDVLSDISSKIEALAPAAAVTGTGGGAFGGGGDAALGGGALSTTGLGTGDRADWKQFFSGFGVDWPYGSSITYMPSVGKIFVANTPDNLMLFERILNVFNVTPSQIEIEARFVEVFQTDIDSLGIEWMLTDDWEVKQKEGQNMMPASQRQRVVVGANSSNGGFTRGNRFLSDLDATAGVNITGADDLLSVASVLTNPELTMVLHALEQKGNTDLLSAPKVTTKSGQQATIKVVTEYIYPTDFEVTPILAQTEGGASVVVGGIVQPGGFQTREVGVLLEVLPEVSTEGQLINLTMTPQVVGEPDWKNYGTSYTDVFGNNQQLPMEQPFFHVRTVTTSLSIYNGATVVMGGMITEHRNDVDDKIPLLGDIPVFGRLFRSNYNHSEKRNLLIFVTARLVDPAGRPLKSIESKIKDLAGVGAAAADAAVANQ